ncbi:MAG TPA: YihY/virulence factor BrkB family protein, partial [Terriglobales bacterium]|nr:YihY/virulence factor BrkB family protein [Terriglobales bacterium]
MAASFRRFYEDKCFTSAIVVSYFALLCCVPLIALFIYISAKIVGSPAIALRSLNIFTDEFFARNDPSFFTKLQGISDSVRNLGMFGLLGSLVAGSFLFSSLIAAINNIFRTRYHRSFFYNRLMEYLVMFIIGVVMVTSLAITTIWTAVGRSIQESEIVRSYFNPHAVSLANNIFLKYVIPYLLTFLVFFILFKFIPETKVHTRAALLPAAITALLYEIFKRIFAFYVVHFSAVGIVLNKLLQGTLTSIIFFLLWISTSMLILLWGVELAALINEKLEA